MLSCRYLDWCLRMHVSDTNAKKDLNAYRRHMATAIHVDVKLAGKDDTARKVILLSILSYMSYVVHIERYVLRIYIYRKIIQSIEFFSRHFLVLLSMLPHVYLIYLYSLMFCAFARSFSIKKKININVSQRRHVARSTPGSIIAKMDVGVDDPWSLLNVGEVAAIPAVYRGRLSGARYTKYLYIS